MTPALKYEKRAHGSVRDNVFVCWKYAGLSYPSDAFDNAVYEALVLSLTLPAGVPVINYLPPNIPRGQAIVALVVDELEGGLLGQATPNVFWNRGEGDPNVVFVKMQDTPEELANLIAHEVGHEFSYPDGGFPAHESELVGGKPNLMKPNGPYAGCAFSGIRVTQMRASNARFMAGERFGPHLAGGQWTVGWYNARV